MTFSPSNLKFVPEFLGVRESRELRLKEFFMHTCGLFTVGAKHSRWKNGNNIFPQPGPPAWQANLDEIQRMATWFYFLQYFIPVTHFPTLLSPLPIQITKSNLESSGIRNLETIEKDQGNKPKDITTAEINTGLQDKQGFFPKFTVFSGEEPKPKNEASFEEWRYEVNCTRSDHVYPDQAEGQAIRRSLKGQAKKVLLPMGTSSTVQEIIERLEGVFGNVAAGESVMQEFYTATQNQMNQSLLGDWA